MKIRRIVSVIVLGLPLACGKPPADQPPPPPQQQTGTLQTLASRGVEEVDADNLLNLGIGASVVSRTGEGNLEQSAVQAIDSLHATIWSSPPDGRNETLVFALAAPSRIERIGITPVPSQEGSVGVRFEASPDAKTWREVAVVDIKPKDEPQLFDVPPFEASFLRASTVRGTGYYTYFRSVHALGKELQLPSPRHFAGCWTINGLPTRIVQDGARLTGVVGTSPPTWLDGGSDGRIAKLMWMRGPNWGFAVLAMSPETRTISGSTFFHMISLHHQGPAWIGTKCERQAEIASAPDNLPSRFLERAGKWSMYGLAFDDGGRLLEEPSRATLETLTRLLRRPSRRLRVIAHEVRGPDREQNRLRSAARVDALRAALHKRGVDVARLELIAAGSEGDPTYVVSTVQRVMVSRVDVEVIPKPE